MNRPLSHYLSTADVPPLDLFIRTGGETRVSNFLLWQIAYSELYFSEYLWPEFNESKLMEAIEDYSGRQRRFGKTGDQVVMVRTLNAKNYGLLRVAS